MSGGERTRAACLASAMAEIGQPEIHWPQPINAQVSRAIEGQLDSRIAQARRDMGEDRWNELNAEWEYI